MGKKSKPKPSNGDVLYALKMAAPLAIASRFDGFAHCVEASVAGANALREFGFKTETAPCAVRLVNHEAASTMTIGYTPRQIYDNMKATPENPLPPFEEWQKAYAAAVPDEEAPMHQIIWAKSDGETFLIDLTIAQLREPRGPGWDSLPLGMVVECGSKAWPILDKGPWQVAYEASRHSPQALGKHAAKVAQYAWKPFADDIRNLMDLGFQVGLDFDAMTAAMRASNPDVYAEASERLDRRLGLQI